MLLLPNADDAIFRGTSEDMTMFIMCPGYLQPYIYNRISILHMGSQPKSWQTR